MIELVVCSGKGGTGKTSVAADLAALAGDFVLADCDVDAANLHLVLEPEIERTQPFLAGHLAIIQDEACLACGDCHDLCRFEAIEKIEHAGDVRYRVDPLACEGCGVCVHFCPVDAIDFPERLCGEWHVSRTRFGPLVHARLHVGAANSGKLVTLVRQQARLLAERTGADRLLVDGPPGIGCPTSAALTGADAALLVTEPSLSGLHDLARILEMTRHFDIPSMVCINKYDLSPQVGQRIEEHCRENGISVVGRIPYEPQVNEAQAAGLSLIEYAPESKAAGEIRAIWQRIERNLLNTTPEKG